MTLSRDLTSSIDPMDYYSVRSKKGTYLIEAAMVLPIIILSIITIVLVIMYYYECAVAQSEMHKALRHEAELKNGKTVYYDESDYDGSYVFDYRKGALSTSRDISMIHQGILRSRDERVIKSSWRTTNGVRYVLIRQKAGEIVKNEE